ncbi:MAG: DUF3800 domain-containing protein [Anaerolineales bacterium]|nr:DUF3800 domain-containing protein [Anaerolineales bacterium]
MEHEYFIYADESVQEGEYFSDFYGGALVSSAHLREVVDRLGKVKLENNFRHEVKWQRVTANYLQKYMEIMDEFFYLVAEDKIKVRIMFSQNRNLPIGLSSKQRDKRYHLLYYQFIKHAFGLEYATHDHDVGLRIYLDKMPDTEEANRQFKSHLVALQKSPQFQRARLIFRSDQIAEVDSRDHLVLQYVDIVLGAMQFRLNKLHLARPEGQRRRGKRTRAKEQLYKHIYKRICTIYPNFNIGISTGQQGDKANPWRHPYRHWLFVPRNSATRK